MSIASKILLTLLIPAVVMWVIGDDVDMPLLRIIGGVLVIAPFIAMMFVCIIAAIWA